MAAHRQSGKAGLVELVLWDVILLVLVVALVFIQGRLADRMAKTPDEPGPAAPTRPDSPPPTERPATPDAPVTSPPSSDPGKALEARADKALDELKARSQDLDPEKALALYAEAPAWLRTSTAWKRRAESEQERLRRMLRGADLLTALKPEIQLAADHGQTSRVQALLARIPASHRATLESEVAWAKAHQPVKATGMEIRGFNPNLKTLKGEQCSLECSFEQQSQGSALLGALDGVVRDVATILGGDPPRLLVNVLGPAAAPVPTKNQILIYQRASEGPAEVTPRARLAAAQAAVAALAKPSVPKWLIRATAAMLASGRSSPDAAGLARRRLFLLTPPDGKGTRLQAIAAGRDTNPELGAWALTWFAFASTDPAALELRKTVRAALRGQTTLASSLTGLRAAGLEPVFMEFLRRAP